MHIEGNRTLLDIIAILHHVANAAITTSVKPNVSLAKEFRIITEPLNSVLNSARFAYTWVLIMVLTLLRTEQSNTHLIYIADPS